MATKDTGGAKQYLAQQIAAGHWSPTKSLDSYKSGYLNRIARQFRAQEAKGLTPNAQAARGHAITPEHPNRKSPGKAAYASGRSKYAKAKVTAGGGGGGGGRKIQRPRVHKRPGIPPVFHAGDNSVTFTLTEERDAAALLEGHPSADGFRLRPDDRVVLTVFDCHTNRWATVFVNPGHSPGIKARALREEWDASGASLEAWALNVLDNTSSDPLFGGAGLTHICLWQIHVFPRNEGHAPGPPPGAPPRLPRPTRPLRPAPPRHRRQRER